MWRWLLTPSGRGSAHPLGQPAGLMQCLGQLYGPPLQHGLLRRLNNSPANRVSPVSRARPMVLDPYTRSGDSVREDAPEGCPTSEFNKENLPPVMQNEIEFAIKDCRKYSCGTSVRSECKTVGNFRFRLLIFPGGTQTAGGQQVSAFVEADPVEGLDPRWCFHGVKYQISLVNWTDYRRSVTKSDIWSFSRDGIDRGWHDMVRVAELMPESGWLGPDNTLLFRAACYVRAADQLNLPNDYSCKKETGFTGLKNHGATCYMNGLLQSLFHVGEFRRIVYSIESDDAADNTEDLDGKPQLIQALQNVFYKMQLSDQAVNCKELMKSFGWDTMDAFTQHDAQELNRILCDRLEERMKNTPSDGSIKRLFEGEMENYIECMDVDYKSRRNETFYDIQLTIKSQRGQELQNIAESLHDFTAEETLEGDNAYEAEGYGKQRAKKGIRFLRFPPVLNLQLKRFHFDLEKMDMVKLNSRFEFPHKLDLSPFMPDAGRYNLFAVVVHNGDVNSGHYYAHIQPDPERGWFKFDDEMVTPCSEFAAVEDNYGGSDLGVWNYFDHGPHEPRGMAPHSKPRIHNAYLLMYIREDLSKHILTPPDPKVVSPKLVDRIDREVRLAEQRRRERVEQQTKIRIKLVTEADLCQMTGFWDHQQVPCSQTYKFGRESPVKDLMEQFSQETGIDQNHMALFVLQYRSSPPQIRFGYMQLDSAFKLHIPPYGAPHYDASDPSLLVLVVMSRGYSVRSLRWSREGEKPDDLSAWDEEKVTMLVVKYFCAQTKRIVTLGCYYLPSHETLMRMVADGWMSEKLESLIRSKQVPPPPEEADVWSCWEEFSKHDLQLRNTRRSVKLEQLFSGDAVIWQKMHADDEKEARTPLEVQIDPDIPPTYPILTVADLAAHEAEEARGQPPVENAHPDPHVLARPVADRARSCSQQSCYVRAIDNQAIAGHPQWQTNAFSALLPDQPGSHDADCYYSLSFAEPRFRECILPLGYVMCEKQAWRTHSAPA
ncbi:Ubiquitin carboxyl-terminal hydrolase 12 [Symbiodinium microadriaticum]|uniref:Ubiquitin carboxyl-terminal hydrolase 12 n=2 Tax=Symbiodinium TaxID=2949 RepID=A0A1Q9CBS3_SYMMI|nr:Ubiquitin carboxyl-terminal hydrolase 12 [Symbiodinium microadriaticum]